MIVYKIDILKSLKEKGYNTNYLRKNKVLSQATIQSIRNKEYISLSTIDRICELLNCNISDIIEYVDNDQNQNQNTE